MGFEVAVGTLNIGTGALTTNYSVTGKTPATGSWKAVILFWSGRPETTDAAGATDIQPGIGVATSSTQRWTLTCQSDHSPTTTATDRCFQTTACVVALSITGVITPTGTSVAGFADFVSFNSDGFTLTIDDVFPAAIEVGYVLLGGSDLTNAQAGTFTSPAGAAPVNPYDALTALSFVPEFVLVVANEASSSAGSFATAIMSIGAAVSSSAQFVTAFRSNDAAATSSTSGYINTTDILASPQTGGGGTTGPRDRFVDFAPSTGNGFRMNYVEGGGGSLLRGYLCLKGGTYAIGNFLSATNTTAYTEAHGMSVTPKGAMFFSANRAENTVDVTTSQWQQSMGASDGTNNYCHYIADKHNSALADCFTAVSHDQCYFNCDTSLTPMSMNGEGHVNSFDSTNINFQMADADPVASFICYVAFGDEVAAAVTWRPPPISAQQAVHRASYW